MSRVYDYLTEKDYTARDDDRRVVSFYQNGAGELCAIVCEVRDGEYSYRFVNNIEKMGYSSENLLEQTERGFDDFSEPCPLDLGGYSLAEIAYGITESEDYRLVAEFDGNISGFVPENMDSRAAALFEPLMDSYVAEAERQITASAAEHECQLCFFAA